MYKVVSIILASVLLLSCNNKATIDLTGFELMEDGDNDLLGKWELTDMTIDELITDNPNITIEVLSEEEAEPGSIQMEFLSSGKVITSLMYYDDNNALQSMDFEDRYILSADKQTFRIIGEEEDYKIVSLTPGTFTYRHIDEVDFLGEVVRFWATYTFKRIK